MSKNFTQFTKAYDVQEKVLDKFETGEKERIVKGMKKDSKGLKKRYGKDWKSVMYATATKKAKEAGDTSKSDKRYAYEDYDVDDAVEYFYEEGVTEEELDMIIEEVGDDIVDFIDEERKARKMNVRSKGKLKKDVAKIKANKSDIVPRKTSPKDALNRAASARVFGKKKLKRPESTVTKTTKKVKSAPKKAASKPAPKAAPKKKASKEGIRSRLKSAYKKGVARHKKAVSKNEFAKGVVSGVKAVGKAAKDVHSITQVNKKKTVNMQSYEPEGEMIEEKKPQKAMDAGAKARRKLARKEYAAKISGSEDNVPDDIRETDQRLKVLEKIKKDRRERAVEPMTTEKMLNKKKNESDPTGAMKPIVAEFVQNLWEASKKCSKCGKVYTGTHECSKC